MAKVEHKLIDLGQEMPGKERYLVKMKLIKILSVVACMIALSASVLSAAELKGKIADGSCCDKAIKAGKECTHPCCVAAAKEGKVCTKCNKQPDDKK